MANDADRITTPESPSTTTPPKPTTRRQPTPRTDTAKVIGVEQSRIDEADALRSLDDTICRPMPDQVRIWEADRVDVEEEQRSPFPKPRLSTAALVAGVAVVSFVAGGITARLSSQVPVLFQQDEPKPIESTAVYTPTNEPAEEEPEEEAPVEQEETEPQGISETWNTYQSPRDQTTTEDDTGGSPERTYTWDLDSEGDRTISYDYDADRMTLDYDGYSFTVDLDQMMGWPEDTSQTDGYGSSERWSDPSDGYRYDTGTGYDTEETRDRYQWNSGPGWGGIYGWGGGYRS